MAWTVAIGVDTHKDVHVAVACDRLGRELDGCQLQASASGYAQLWQWAQALGEPAFAIEGCGSYGAGLARFLQASGASVFECERPRRRERGRGKSDRIDAALAARRLLSGTGLSRPRGRGRREQLRLLLLERRGVVASRTAALNQLQGVLVSAPERLRQRLGCLHGAKLARAARVLPKGGAEQGTLVGVLRRLGRRVEQLEADWPSSTPSWRRSCARWFPSCPTNAAPAPSAPPSSLPPAATRRGCEARRPSPRSPARARSMRRAGASSGTGSIALATGN